MNEPTIERYEELVDLVSEGCAPDARGPVVVQRELWNGRTIIARYSKTRRPSLRFAGKLPIVDDRKLCKLVDKLLETGKGFTTQTGEDDLVCTLRWGIRRSKRSGRSELPGREVAHENR